MILVKGIQRDSNNVYRRIVELGVIYFVQLAIFLAYSSVFDIGLNSFDIITTIICSTVAAILVVKFMGILFARFKRTKIYVGIAGILIVIIFIIKKITIYKMLVFWGNAITPFYNSFVKRYNNYYLTELYVYNYTADKAETKLIVFLLATLLCMVFLYVMKKKSKLFLAIVIMFGPFVACAMVGKFPSIMLVLMILYFGLILITLFYDKGTILPKAMITNITVVLVVLSAVALLLEPVAKEYRNENKDKFDEVRSKIVEMQQPQFWTDLVDGFNLQTLWSIDDKGDLSKKDKFEPDKKVDIKVTVDYKPTSPIYIIDYVGMNYTGDSWEEIDKSYYDGVYSGLIGSNVYKMSFDRVNSDYKNNIKIENIDLPQSVGFVTYYSLVENNKVHMDAYVKGDRDVYEYTFFRSKIAENPNNFTKKNNENWELYNEFVYDTYININNYDYIAKICKDFDRASYQTVEKYINRFYASEFKYDINPGKVPSSSDFSKYFLTENKKGFCVHYATGAVLMYRECGIPARYVEGYLVEPSDFYKNEDGTYSADVTDESGHAWCEIFQRTRGWTPVEHTLGYVDEPEETTSRPEVQTTRPVETTSAEEVTTQEGETTEQETTANQETTTVAVAEKVTTEQETEHSVDEGGNGIGNGNGSGNGTNKENIHLSAIGTVVGVIVQIVIVILVLVITLCLQCKIRRIKRLRKIKSLNHNSSVRYIYNEICNIYKYLGVESPEKDERKFFEEMISIDEVIDSTEWEWIYDCVRRAAFSKERISRTECQKMYTIYKKVREKTLNELKFVRRIEFIYIKAL